MNVIFPEVQDTYKLRGRYATGTILQTTILLPALLLLAGCSGSRSTDTTLTVFAAASLTEAFEELASTFTVQHPDVEVQLHLAGSQQLAQQLVQGAPADLFASADMHQMAVAVEAGRIAEEAAQPFAGNKMVLITPAANPAGIERLAEIARPGIKLVLAGEAVPAGRYARLVLAQAAAAPDFDADFAGAATANVVSYEQNVRAVLTKVVLGEADAGLVYASDVRGAGVNVLEIADSFNVHARYLLAPVADSTRPELARTFFDFVLSAEGQQILASHGLQPPAES